MCGQLILLSLHCCQPHGISSVARSSKARHVLRHPIEKIAGSSAAASRELFVDATVLVISQCLAVLRTTSRGVELPSPPHSHADPTTNGLGGWPRPPHYSALQSSTPKLLPSAAESSSCRTLSLPVFGLYRAAQLSRRVGACGFPHPSPSSVRSGAASARLVRRLADHLFACEAPGPCWQSSFRLNRLRPRSQLPDGRGRREVD